MGRKFKIVVAAFLLLAMTGCNSEEQGASKPTPSAFPNTPSTSSAQINPSKTETFNNPVVAQKQNQQQQTVAVLPAAPGLIQPTNPIERTNATAKGRVDPFAQLSGLSVPTVKNTSSTPKPVPTLPSLPKPKRSPDNQTALKSSTKTKSAVSPANITPKGVTRIGLLPGNNTRPSTNTDNPRKPNTISSNTSVRKISPSNKTSSSTQRPSVKKHNESRLAKVPQAISKPIKPIKPNKPLKPNSPKNQIAKLPKITPTKPALTPVIPKQLPAVVPNPSLISIAPPPIQPELARAVLVSGVVLVGSQPQAIIKVPDEPTSRYVQAGDRLSNGLLVKRIEMNEGSEPIVILEQYGMEVARTVGEKAIQADNSSPGNPPTPPTS
jgi:hypothetical protein